ncbi:hypothetical protein HYFRA_00006503 [Hymenoscyphus fraxineus]|uniref:Uncharacterized protein n=1 Tax=Hymenoscyphus fraxineus TaxID=746836 RepID=A0A9N9KS30_9HELO|nr:hypothetical protein HYFRA_00006503 [Hymenoscyphus fraxineus]
MLAIRSNETTVGSASGSLQDTDPVLIWKKPRLIHDSKTYPKEMKRPSKFQGKKYLNLFEMSGREEKRKYELCIRTFGLPNGNRS